MSGGFDVNELMRQAMALQQQLAEAQDQAADTEVDGTSGGGAVTVTMTGTGEVTRVRIDPAVVDPDEVELLEDLVLAAIHDAAHRAAELQAGALGGMAGLGALAGLGDLGDLVGLGLDVGGLPELGEGVRPGPAAADRDATVPARTTATDRDADRPGAAADPHAADTDAAERPDATADRADQPDARRRGGAGSDPEP